MVRAAVMEAEATVADRAEATGEVKEAEKAEVMAVEAVAAAEKVVVRAAGTAGATVAERVAAMAAAMAVAMVVAMAGATAGAMAAARVVARAVARVAAMAAARGAVTAAETAAGAKGAARVTSPKPWKSRLRCVSRAMKTHRRSLETSGSRFRADPRERSAAPARCRE